MYVQVCTHPDIAYIIGVLGRYLSNIIWKAAVRNPSVSLSPTLTRNEKVEHYIRIKTHKPIALRFWVESGVSVLCG